jgi:hypothetical protein
MGGIHAGRNFKHTVDRRLIGTRELRHRHVGEAPVATENGR